MDFIALDFETANHKKSPCAIGVIVVYNNKVVEEIYSLINPEQPFNSHCVRVHGITKDVVRNSPTFNAFWPIVSHYFRRLPVVAHSVGFDKAVLEKSARRYAIELLPIVYYDTLTLYRHNYSCDKGLDLESMCKKLGITVESHHNALDDARAAAHAMIAMLENQNNDIFPLLFAKDARDTSDYDGISSGIFSEFHSNSCIPEPELELVETKTIIDNINEVVLNGNVFVLTGIIPGYSRAAAVARISEGGGSVANTVSKKTKYVVAGLQDTSIVTDKENARSGKLIRAEELRSQGHDIRIISVDTFLSALKAQENN